MSFDLEDRAPLITAEKELDTQDIPRVMTTADKQDQLLDPDNTSEQDLLVSRRRSPRSRCYSVSKAIGRWMLTNLLLILTIASVIVGIILGVCVREVDLPKHSSEYRLMVQLLSFPGEIFLRMLKMLILPLIVFSLLSGLGSLESKVAGSLGWKIVLYYFSTTVLAVILGLILVSSIKPGGRVEGTVDCNNSTHGMRNDIELVDTVLDLIRNMLPDNLFTATFRQSATVYTYEDVTDYMDCLNNNFNRSELNDSLSCPDIRSFITTSNVSCLNSTQLVRHISIAPREGMNILGIIVFTIAFAIVLGRLGSEGRKVIDAFGVLNEAIMKLVSLVMWYSPIGIASIISGKLAEIDDFSALVTEVGFYTVTVMVGLLIHGCIVLPIIYMIFTRRNPLKLIKAITQALLTAFGTSSSSATLPVTIQNLEDNFHADPRVTRFMLPVGATINMDGTALYEAVAAVFIAQVQGITLTFDRLIIVSITATLASIGAAGVPQAGLFTLVIVLVAVGLDPENVALIIAVDWLLDRFRTTVNVLGDSFGVGIVNHHSRKQLAKSLTSMQQDEHEATHAHSQDDVPAGGGYGSASSPDDSSRGGSGSRQFSPASYQWSGPSTSEDHPQVYVSETATKIPTDTPPSQHGPTPGTNSEESTM